MAFDFLNRTTIDPQLEQQQQQLSDMEASQAAAQAHDPNDPQDLEEIQDQDVNDLQEQDEDHVEISDDDADKMATDTHDFENEQPDEIDYQLMSYIMGDGNDSPRPQSRPQMQYGGGTLGSAGTVHSNEAWLKNKVNHIKFQGLNQNRSKYASQLPTEPGTPSGSAYENIQQNAIQAISSDPIAQKMGINVMGNAKTGGAYSSDYQNGGRYSFPGMKPKRQIGGSTLFADDEATLRQGLNNNNYQRAVLKLQGTNTIRGLDNHQPVAVTDGKKYKVLNGPKDTAQFKGNVYENRL